MDWRWPAREDRQAVPPGMAGKVHKNINFVGDDSRRDGVVVETEDRDPTIDRPADPFGERVGACLIGVDNHLKVVVVMGHDRPRAKPTHGVTVKIT